MKDEEIAEDYAKENRIVFEYEGMADFVQDELKCACLAGLKAGRPKWHDLRKDPNDLPETRHPVYAKLDSGTYVFAYCVNEIWYRNDDGIILYHGNGKSEVIAWCEIPKYTEE